ncbi:MAG: amidohydrolase family protein [Candidatus Sumerlaeia bacterium]|nr:amidohydrolase family protein [Candidatus Sumerlaeia bacterium]
MDFLLSNGTIVTDGLEFSADLAIRDGIVSVIGDLDGLTAKEEIDCSGKLIFPGAVDLGLNLLDDGPFDQESGAGFALASMEAAIGGVTTLITTMELEPDDDIVACVRAQAEADSRKSWVDFSYHLLFNEWGTKRADQVRQAINAGIPSAWLARTPLDSSLPAPTLFLSAMEDIPEDFLVVLSPYLSTLAQFSLNKLMSNSPFPNRQWKEALPENFEVSAIQTLAHLANSARCRILLNGISTCASLAALQSARENSGLIAGACSIHHLFFTDGDGDAVPRLWPPCRTKQDQHALFNALEEGLVSAVTSAHKPRTPQESASPVIGPDLPQVGAASLSHFMPILHGEGVTKWRITPATLSLCACADPAKLAGCYPRKGSIQPGSDADIVVIDPSDAAENPAQMEENGFSDPYRDHGFQGRIEHVFLRGQRIYDKSGLVEAPSGSFIERRLVLK